MCDVIKNDCDLDQSLSNTSSNIDKTGSNSALAEAEKLGIIASKVGFDWPTSSGSFAKVNEELHEVAEAERLGNHEYINEEIGDLLFAVVNLARHLRVDSEYALDCANQKFAARFKKMEQFTSANKKSLKDYSLDELEQLWLQVKSNEL